MHPWAVLIALGVVTLVGGDLPPQECPQECSCYYFRIHWVTACSHRDLTMVPSGLSSSTYMLDLAKNRINSLELPTSMRLRTLLLTNNAFTTLLRDHFQGLGLLLEVDLSGNQLTLIDKNTFQDSPGLITLRLSRNPRLKESGEPFLVSRSLQTLELMNCAFTKLTAGFFSGTPSLHRLDLSGNPLTTIEAGVFTDLTGLTELSLERTLLAQIPATAFPSDAPLHVLSLAKGKLAASALQPLLSVLGHLETLDLSDLELELTTAEHASAFVSNPYLQSLKMSGNNLGGLDLARTLGHLRNLQSLDVSLCQLHGELLGGEIFTNLTRLRSLIFSGNHLAVDLTTLLEPLTRLHTLTLRNCSLSSTSFLRRLTPLRQSLRALDLSFNPLGDEEVNSAGSLFPLLESLDVSNCNLTRVSASAFSSATNLVSLALSGNPLMSQLETSALSSLARLSQLYMENCDLKGPPGPEVYPPGQAPLKELRLAGNPLSPNTHVLIPEHLSGLTLLDISRSGIAEIPSSSLSHASELLKLIAADNPLSGDNSLPKDLSKLAPKLQLLDLRRCSLISLETNERFASSDHLRALYLKGNPWSCDCSLVQLWRWATQRGVALQEEGEALKCDGVAGPWTEYIETLNCEAA